MIERDAVVAGRYRLVDRIGVGGMGSVWKAHDERLDRTVALKLLHPRPGMSDPEAQMAKDRALREARNTARLHHRHAVPVFDVVEHEGQPCLVMQYLPSRTLEQILAEHGRLPADEVALIGAEVASALAAAHEAGIVHRDVKPANVLISEDGTAHLTDFGISHALGDATLTSAGMITGTPAYLAPEVARGADSTFAADVFSLGATLHAAIEGQPPFGHDPNSMAQLHRVASGSITAPTRAGGLTPLLLRMLASRPEDRPTMAEAAHTLEHLDVSAGPDVAETAVLPPVGAPTTPPPAGTPGDRTQQLRAGTAAADPSPAAYGGEREGRPRSRGWFLLVGVVLAVALAAALGSRGLFGDSLTAQPDKPSAATTRSTSAAAARTTPPTRTAPPSIATSTAAPSTARPSATPPGTPTAGRLADAISGYYALLPADTRQGYSLLTDRFRRDKAGSFESYDAFWGRIRTVSASDVVGRPPGGAEATLRYAMADGRVIVERTAFQLVQDGGVLKIDSTRLLARLQ